MDFEERDQGSPLFPFLFFFLKMVDAHLSIEIATRLKMELVLHVTSIAM